jgi:hypothetical protein
MNTTMLPKDLQIKLLFEENASLHLELDKAKTFINEVHNTFAREIGNMHVMKCSNKDCDAFVALCRNSQLFKWNCKVYLHCGACDRTLCDSHMDNYLIENTNIHYFQGDLIYDWCDGCSAFVKKHEMCDTLEQPCEECGFREWTYDDIRIEYDEHGNARMKH